MMSECRTHQTVLLSVLLVGASALLRGKLDTPCANSDGLVGYSFSHKGLWIPGYRLLGTGFTRQSCSIECSKSEACVAFSGSFAEEGGNGGCYTYTATGGNVPAGGDRAYRKCKGAVPDMSNNVPAFHLIASGQTVGTEDALMQQAEGMEKQLDQVGAIMKSADARLRRLRSLVAGAANVLTSAGRMASSSAETALGNTGGLQAIARQKDMINRTFTSIERKEKRMDKLLARIKTRVPKDKGGTKSKGPTLAGLEPNVTALEKKMNLLNDEKTAASVDEMVNQYKKYSGDVDTAVKGVVNLHIRELVDTMRVAYYNYTSALQDKKKDPCCCKDMKKESK